MLEPKRSPAGRCAPASAAGAAAAAAVAGLVVGRGQMIVFRGAAAVADWLVLCWAGPNSRT